MSEAFFFFGSLRDPLILEAVLGRDLSHLAFGPGTLRGHRIERAAGYTFPVLMPAAGCDAPGTIVDGLSAADIARIAYFEDSEYELASAAVETEDGPRDARFYASSAKIASSGEAWSLESFQAHDRALLLAVTRFVMTEHYPATPQATMEAIWGSIRDRIARELGLETRP